MFQLRLVPGAVVENKWHEFVSVQVPVSEASGIHNQAREEAEVVYNLSHANIVNTLSHELKRFHDTGGAATHFKLYMIQEYCAGGTLANLVKHGHLMSKEGGVRFERALMLLRDVAAGLAYVHSQDIGASHRFSWPLLLETHGPHYTDSDLPCVLLLT